MARRQADTLGTQLDKPRRTRKRRSDEEKAKLLAEAAVRKEAGETHSRISSELDIPRTTLVSWISQGDLEAVRTGTSEPIYRQIKANMLNDFAQAAQNGLQAVNGLFVRVQAAGTSEEAKAYAGAVRDAAVAMGIAADKVLLLIGQPTSRSERIAREGEGGVTADMFQEAMKALGVRLPSKAEPIDAEYAVKDECDKTRA